MPPRPTTDARAAVDAIVVAGGRARRLGGLDKGALLWNGVALRQRALTALATAGHIVWVGDDWPAAVPAERISFVREQPMHGGPAAALGAGIAALPHPLAPWIVVLSADLPRVEEALPPLLGAVAALGDDPLDGVIAVDADGVRQPLLAIYRAPSLVAAVQSRAGDLDGLSLRGLLHGLELRELALPHAATHDVDTPADAAYHGIDLPQSPEESGS